MSDWKGDFQEFERQLDVIKGKIRKAEGVRRDLSTLSRAEDEQNEVSLYTGGNLGAESSSLRKSVVTRLFLPGFTGLLMIDLFVGTDELDRKICSTRIYQP